MPTKKRVNFHWIAARTHPKTTNSPINQEVNKPGPAIADPNCSPTNPVPGPSTATTPTSFAQAPLKTREPQQSNDTRLQPERRLKLDISDEEGL